MFNIMESSVFDNGSISLSIPTEETSILRSSPSEEFAPYLFLRLNVASFCPSIDEGVPSEEDRGEGGDDTAGSCAEEVVGCDAAAAGGGSMGDTAAAESSESGGGGNGDAGKDDEAGKKDDAVAITIFVPIRITFPIPMIVITPATTATTATPADPADPATPATPVSEPHQAAEVGDGCGDAKGKKRG